MVTVHEAETLLFDKLTPLSPERVSLSKACGRILLEPILADRALPPFDRVAMDGIAVSFSQLESGRHRFFSNGIQRAGEPCLQLRDSEGCLEVMTGAPLPGGCDCVIPYEDVEFIDNHFLVKKRIQTSFLKNVHPLGADIKAGEGALEPGIRLLPTHLAVAAAVGATTLAVSRQPAIGVISTGNELVSPETIPLPYQIRQSNSFAIQSCLISHGFPVRTNRHLRDNEEIIRDALGMLLITHDVLIFSGGVSKGRFDFLPDALKDGKVHIVFHGVNQKPGKPFLFGIHPSCGALVFGLPGNPISCLVALYRYVVPALFRMSGLVKPLEKRVLMSETVMAAKNGFVRFLPVKLVGDASGRWSAKITNSNGSGDFLSLTHSDGFVEVPAEGASNGAWLPYFSWSGV